jgi:choline-glycine betaine transporter
MSRKRAELYMLIGLAVWTLVYLIGTLRLGSPIVDGEPGQSLFPWIAILIMAAGCIGVFFEKKNQPDSSMSTERSSVKRPLAGCIIVAVFIFLFFLVGYWPSTVILCFCTAYLFEYDSVPRLKALAISALLGVVVPILGYIFYEILFGIRLPEGGLF